MAAKTFLYFGYGSNLLRERLSLANPSAVFKTVGRLAGYKLVFIGHSGRWEGAVASIEQNKEGDVASIEQNNGRDVWGVVWTMNSNDLSSLDRQEGIYTPIDVDVTDPQGKQLRCRTYQLRLGWKPGVPSPHYKDVIIRGARQNQLPDDYLRYLDGIPDNGFQGDVSVYKDVMKLIGESPSLPPSSSS